MTIHAATADSNIEYNCDELELESEQSGHVASQKKKRKKDLSDFNISVFRREGQSDSDFCR